MTTITMKVILTNRKEYHDSDSRDGNTNTIDEHDEDSDSDNEDGND